MPAVLRPAGVLVVRAWLEEHSAEPLRAVVTHVVDLGTDAPTVRTAACSVDEVCRLVRAWLEEVGAQGGATGDGPPARGER